MSTDETKNVVVEQARETREAVGTDLPSPVFSAVGVYEPPLSHSAQALIDAIRDAYAAGPCTKAEVWIDRTEGKQCIGAILIEGNMPPEMLARKVQIIIGRQRNIFSRATSLRLEITGPKAGDPKVPELRGGFIFEGSSHDNALVKQSQAAEMRGAETANASLAHALGVLGQLVEGVVRSSHTKDAQTYNQMWNMLQLALADNERMKAREVAVIEAYGRVVMKDVDADLRREEGRMVLQAKAQAFQIFVPLIMGMIEQWRGKPIVAPALVKAKQFFDTVTPEQMEMAKAAFAPEQYAILEELMQGLQGGAAKKEQTQEQAQEAAK